jgi:ribosome biogenesis GTPase A
MLQVHEFWDPYQLTGCCVCIGVPNSGKSEWIDALLMNLSETYGWGFALCSLEKTPDKHAIQVGSRVTLQSTGFASQASTCLIGLWYVADE